MADEDACFICSNNERPEIALRVAAALTMRRETVGDPGA
jgi:hypothetical protein